MKEEKKKTTKKVTKKTTATKKAEPKKTTVKKETVKKVEPKKEEKKITTKKEVVKEEKKNVKKPNLEEELNTSYKGMVIIVVVTLLVIGLAIGIASIVKKNQKSNNVSTNASIQYDEILLGNLLTQSESEYYVLVYSKDDKYFQTYNTYITNYKTKENALNVYMSVLENGFNKKYVADEKNLFVSNVDEFKIMNTTLLKISGSTVVEAYDGKDAIISYLKQINN